MNGKTFQWIKTENPNKTIKIDFDKNGNCYRMSFATRNSDGSYSVDWDCIDAIFEKMKNIFE